MKPHVTTVLLLTALGCGNYSNDDIEFLNALPHTSDLTSKVPQPNSSQSGLGSPDAGGAPGCGDQVGQTSCFYTQTLASSTQFNEGLYELLGLIDYIETFPPTSRTLDSRTWGPFPDSSQPGFNAEVVIVLTPPNLYSWAIQYQPLGAPAGASWFQWVAGNFTETEGPRLGTGNFKIDGAGAAMEGIPNNGMGDGEAVGAYATDSQPISVTIQVSAQDGGELDTLTYESREYVNDAGVPSSGALQFVFGQQTDAGTAFLGMHSAWLPDGSGRGDAVVEPGSPYAGSEAVQCWGPAPGFAIVYQAENWDPGATVGDPSLCADAGGL